MAPPRRPPKAPCPMCKREVEAVIYNKHCTSPVISSLVYVHANGEKHFVIYEPAHQKNQWSLTSRERVSNS